MRVQYYRNNQKFPISAINYQPNYSLSSIGISYIYFLIFIMKLIVKLLLYAVAILITSYLLPGVHVEDFTSAFILAGVLALLNITIKPLLIILTIPFTVITLGLFLIVINALIILLADSIIPGTNIDGFWWAVLFSFIVSILNGIFSGLTKKDRNIKMR